MNFSPQDVLFNRILNLIRIHWLELFPIPIPEPVTLASGVLIGIGQPCCGESRAGVGAKSPKHNKTEEMLTSVPKWEGAMNLFSLSSLSFTYSMTGLGERRLDLQNHLKLNKPYSYTRVCYIYIHCITLFFCLVIVSLFYFQFSSLVFFPFYAIFFKWGIVEYVFKILLLKS